MSELNEHEPNTSSVRPSGMRAFFVMWIGQFVSLLGSAMTSFAIPIWVFGQTERVQELALLGLAFILPLILMSPVAGTIVDRNNRKMMMILSDLASGVTTIVVLALVLTDSLQIWHLYVTNFVNGAFQTFQWPAYSSAISVMISKEQYGRVAGLTSLARNGSHIFAPLLGGALLGLIGLQGILIIDIVTFTLAIGTLLFIHVPNPPRTVEGQKGQGSILQESAYGFQYIWQRPSLMYLQLVFLFGNFMVTIAITMQAAMILARTDQDATIFAWVSAAGAVGGVAGALLMSAWGGPKRRIHGVLLGWAITGLLGTSLVGIGQSWPVWAVGFFIGTGIIPILNGSNQAIWQSKVAPDIQGRVFSIRRLIAWVSNPLARVLAIPLADGLLEPAMQEGGSLVGTFAWLVGTGAGAGMSLIFVFTGLIASIVGLCGYFVPAIRNVEDILPDHDTMERVEEEQLAVAS